MFDTNNKNTFKIEKWEVDPLHNSIKQGKEVYEIEPKAMKVLVYLAQHSGRTIGYQELQKTIWPEQEVAVSALNRVISNLRRCLGDNKKSPIYIMTIKNTGYRFIAEVTPKEYFSLPSEERSSSKLRSTYWRLKLFFISGGVVFCLISMILIYEYLMIAAPETYKTQYITTVKGAEMAPALSPDGNKVIYFKTGRAEKGILDFSAPLYLMNINSNETMQLTDSVGFSSHPVWSPNNRHIAYAYEVGLVGKQRSYEVHMMDTETKKVEVLSKVSSHAHGLSWSPDGQYLVYPEGAREKFNSLIKLSIASKERQFIRNPDNSNDNYSYPSYSPDGKYIAVIRTDQGAYDNIDLINTDNYSSITILSNQQKISSLTWKDNHILFVAVGDVASSQLMEFSILSGEPKIINVADNYIEYLSYSKSTRRLAYESIQTPFNIHYSVYEGDSPKYMESGNITNSNRQELEGAQSPDGRNIALISSRSGKFEIWLKDSSSGQSKRLTDIKASGIKGLDWSPRSDKLAFVATVNNQIALYWLNVASKQLHRFVQGEHNYSLVGWENKDSSILFSSNPDGEWRLWRLNTNNDEVGLVSNDRVVQGRLSPDRKTIYFAKYKHPGIWGSDLTEIVPVLIPGTESVSIYRSWAVAEKGIFYAVYGDIADFEKLYFQSFMTNKPTLVTKLSGLYFGRIYWGNDRLLYSIYDHRRSDIRMIEGL